MTKITDEMTETTKIALECFRNKIKTANPSFTKKSLRRTLEVCIIESRGLGPLAEISEEDVDELQELTQADWSGRVRLDIKEAKALEE